MELTKGLVVRTNKYHENSKIINVLTTDGITSLLVRAASSYSSKNYSYAQELVCLNFDYSKSRSKGFSTLTQATIINNYTNIKTDSNRLYCALAVLELVNQFSEFVDDYPTLFTFTIDILEKINCESIPKMYTLIYRLKFLFLLGIAPDFHHCDCEVSDDLLGFCLKTGKMKCLKCYNHDSFIKPTLLEVLKYLYYTKLNNITNDILVNLSKYESDLESFLNDYYQTHIDYISRIEKIIKNISE